MPTTEERINSLETVQNQSQSAEQLEDIVNYDVNAYHLVYDPSVGKIVKMKGSLLPLGSHKPYPTVASLPDPTDPNSQTFVAFVNSDPNPITETTGNGYYVVEGGAWVKKTSETENEVNEANTTKGVTGQAVSIHSKETRRLGLKETLSGIEKNFNSIYNGVDSSTTLPSTYTLENEGDSVEFTFSVDDFSDNKGMGILGELGGVTSHIGFYINKQLYIREVGGNWLTTDGLLDSLQENEECTLKLEWVSGAIAVYKNGVFQKNITNGVVKIANTGNSYTSFFKGKIRDIKINVSGVLTEFGSPYFLEVNNNVSISPSKKAYLTPEQISDFSKISKNKSLIDRVTDYYNKSESHFTRYNGSTSESNLTKTYILSQEGDYVEIEMRLYEGISNFNDGLGCFGVKGDTSNTFGFYDNDSIWFRADNETEYMQINGLSGFSQFSKYKLQVINSGTQYEVFKDDISIGVFTKNNDFKVSNVGFGYTASAKIDVKSFKIHTSTEDLNIPNMYFSENVSVDLKLGEETITNDVAFSKCYVSFNPTGNNGNEKFTAFVQNEANPKYYFGFEIAHEINTDELIYMNQYRLQRGNIYEFDGENMIDTGQVALTTGESEFVYKTPNKVDFTGGVHGDEQLVEANFYIDGVRLTDLTTAFSLKPCSEFSYIQKSTMHESATTGDIVNPAHPTEAIHFKHSIFSNSGYTTKNRLIWQNNLTLNVVYGSIVCLSREIGGKGQTSKYEIETFDALGGHKLEEINNNVHVWNETNKMSGTVKSEFDVYNDSSRQFIWDNTTYNKYYRDIARDGDKNVVNGEEWNLITTVKFNKQ